MELVAGAMGSLIPKLKDLLKAEYKLQTGVKDQVRYLKLELESAHAALRKVAKVPPDHLDELVKIWAREVQEASYNMEDILDTFLMHVQGSSKANEDQDRLLKRLGDMMTGLFKKSKERHKIAGTIEKIKKSLHDVTERRGRYTVDSIVAKPAASLNTVDPRLNALYREPSQIIGIDKSSGDLISMLMPKGGDQSNKKMKIVSVMGVGGQGKTTLAKAVYEKLKSQFDCGVFVPVGQNPDLKKVFRDILIDLEKEKYTDLKFTMLDERQLLNELHDILRTKRYFVVIDDIWQPQSWEQIKLAFVENNCGSMIITTTRKFEVAKGADEIYNLQPLSYDESKKLFYTRLFGGEDKCPNSHLVELSNTILKKCGGVPLAIITMASLLLGKSIEEWFEVCNSPGFYRHKDDRHMENTMHILSLSYYDLPSHLKTCLLYLSIFPEDSLIDKDSLIWKWIAEGFVEKKPGRGLYEVGEEYFRDLINRSMIHGVDYFVYGTLYGCRVHDMVLDLIVSISREENFVTANGTLIEGHARRLSQRNIALDVTHDTYTSLPQVRSFILWECRIVKWALQPRLQLIRVLALEGYKLCYDCYSLQFLGNLLHLRYLGLRDTLFHKLPKEIGNRKFLQTLDLEKTASKELPRSIVMLTQLVFLRASWVKTPHGVIGKLTSLEELQIEPPENIESRRQFLKYLGNLCELRVLKSCIREMDKSMQVDLIQSLGNLQKMQHLELGNVIFPYHQNIVAWDGSVPSPHLQCFLLPYISFPKLPSWINSTYLPNLTHLDIYVLDVDEQGIKTLGGLPELCYLRLSASSSATLSNIAADACFQKLRSWVLPNLMVQFLATEDSTASFTICIGFSGMAIGTRKKDDCKVGPVPNLQELAFTLYVQELITSNTSYEDLGLDYLPSLQRVYVILWCFDGFADDVEKVEAAVRHAIDVHPNLPILQIEYMGKEVMKRRPADDHNSATQRDPEVS